MVFHLNVILDRDDPHYPAVDDWGGNLASTVVQAVPRAGEEVYLYHRGTLGRRRSVHLRVVRVVHQLYSTSYAAVAGERAYDYTEAGHGHVIEVHVTGADESLAWLIGRLREDAEAEGG